LVIVLISFQIVCLLEIKFSNRSISTSHQAIHGHTSGGRGTRPKGI